MMMNGMIMTEQQRDELAPMKLDTMRFVIALRERARETATATNARLMTQAADLLVVQARRVADLERELAAALEALREIRLMAQGSILTRSRDLEDWVDDTLDIQGKCESILLTPPAALGAAQETK
jgi:hypothetical protein